MLRNPLKDNVIVVHAAKAVLLEKIKRIANKKISSFKLLIFLFAIMNLPIPYVHLYTYLLLYHNISLL